MTGYTLAGTGLAIMVSSSSLMTKSDISGVENDTKVAEILVKHSLGVQSGTAGFILGLAIQSLAETQSPLFLSLPLLLFAKGLHTVRSCYRDADSLLKGSENRQDSSQRIHVVERFQE